MKKILIALILGVATASFVSVPSTAWSQISKKKKIIKKSKSSGFKGHSSFGKSKRLKSKLGLFDDRYYKDEYYKYNGKYYKYDRYNGFSGHSRFGGRRSFGSRSRFGNGRIGGFTGFDGSRRSDFDRGSDRGSDRRPGRR